MLPGAFPKHHAQADDDEESGAGMAPDYEGSDDYKIVPLPYAKLTLENGMFVNLQGSAVKANLIPSKTIIKKEG